MKTEALASLTAIILLSSSATRASTPTENLGIRALPAPGKVTVDGKLDDWDLSGGIFACDNVEEQRENFGVWIHLMYDAQNLYVAAHWADDTPLNNPGQTSGDYGFQADCLQFRIITSPGTPQALGNHMTCWKGRDGKDVVLVQIGTDFKGGEIKDAKTTHGVQQAFTIDADGKGYVQEMAFPWKVLTKDGQPLKAGDKFTFTVEPNFTTPAKGRLTVKDIFKAGITPDRVFTFMANQSWGTATCEAKGNVEPAPVRLADAREFPVKLENGRLVANWNGLIKQKVLLGFKTIKFNMPVDGYISLNICKVGRASLPAEDGNQAGTEARPTVARQLLNCAFMSKGEHEVKWDGLTNLSWNKPGEPVEPGDYTWNAIYHTGIGLRLKGWACNGGNAPWDGVTGKENWGGDHGLPVACASDQDSVYLGWSGAEAGQALVCCDLDGNVKWKNKRQGMCGAELVAVDGGFVYAVNWGPNGTNYVYRLNAKDGSYACFDGTDSPDLFPRNLWPDPKGKPDRVDGLLACGGKLFLSYTKENAIMVVDAKTGKLERTLNVPAPTSMARRTENTFCVVSGESEVLVLQTNGASSGTLVVGLKNIKGIATDKDGNLYVSVRDPDQQVKVFNKEGKQIAEIGRKGGRAKIGKWTPDGMLEPAGITIDSQGKLWVMEADTAPKRVSVWDSKTGKFIKEFFGPSSYGALGGAINPVDPSIMVGQGCEWKLDSQTGRSTCLGTIVRTGMENSRFAVGSNGKLYLAVAGNWSYNVGPLNIFERVGDADYKLRTVIYYADADGKELPTNAHGEKAKTKKTMVWSDVNGDGERQPEEISGVDGELRFSGWYMSMLPNLTMYSGSNQFKCTGFTACGAPKYDLGKPVPIAPGPVKDMWGLGSPDDRFYLYDGPYNVNHGLFACVDIASGKTLWQYPSNFTGVHGSHNACPPEIGMVRGSFGACGAAKLPDPIGNVWVIATNVGEWHLLTDRGFYLTRLFQGDPMKMQFPEKAVPGAILDNCPPGMGGEDFGGSCCYVKAGTEAGATGNLYVQAGKTGFWNAQVVGLDTVKEMKGERLQITAEDVKQAHALREQQLQAVAGTKRMNIAHKTATFTGNWDQDTKGLEIASFSKSEDAAVRTAAAWDDQNLYLMWDVRDATPWGNSAEVAEEMYVRGDTVDFQLGTDAKADKNRGEAGLGDLRLSIGSLKGKETAVLYRKRAAEKHPKTFSSGVIKEYVMESVTIVDGAKITAKKRDKAYTVEAAIPLSALDLKPTGGLSLRGDFGVTHGDQASQRTRLRTYWNNQHTGIVDDVVFELQMEPKNWGELIFQQ
ncbi:MAG TPA: sugar-binding protein [Planctomycetota bacterium]|jgi:hypothetical protein